MRTCDTGLRVVWLARKLLRVQKVICGTQEQYTSVQWYPLLPCRQGVDDLLCDQSVALHHGHKVLWLCHTVEVLEHQKPQ